MLEPLKEGGFPRVLIKGKIYQLTEKSHIVCASNPLDYGGGRVMQKLFKENDIPTIHLEDIPSYTIYERMLKPMYRQISLYLSEDEFEKECLTFLIQYKQNKELSVRNLQEWAITFAMQTRKTAHKPLLIKEREPSSPI